MSDKDISDASSEPAESLEPVEAIEPVEFQEPVESFEPQETVTAESSEASPAGAGAVDLAGDNSDNVPPEPTEAPEPPSGDDNSAKAPLDDGDSISTHPKKSPETLPEIEKEPISIPNPEGGKIKPPKEWRPGGPEGGW